MRSCDMYMKIIVHLIACVFDWSESKYSRNHKFSERARHDLQQKTKDRTGIRWGYADPTWQCGITTTGNNYRQLLHDPSVRKLIASEVPEANKSLVRDCLSFCGCYHRKGRLTWKSISSTALILICFLLQNLPMQHTNTFLVHGSVSHHQCTKFWPILGNQSSKMMDMAWEIGMKQV